jgi:hypothetical protein
MSQKRVNRNKRRTTAEWQALLTEQVQSGLSVRTFCVERGIGYSTLIKWKSRLGERPRATTQPSDFIEVSPAAVLATTHWDLELALGSDIVLRLARH